MKYGRLALALGTTLLVVVLLVVPGLTPARVRPPAGTDKLVHMILFGILALVWSGVEFRRLSGWMVGLLVPLGLAVATEAVQLLIPYRQAEWMDLAADAVGIFLVLALLLIIRRLRRDQPER